MSTDHVNGNGSKPVILNRTVVSVSVVVVAIATSVTATLWFTGQLSALDQKSRDRFTLTDMRLWAAETRRLNAALNLPEPTHYEAR